MHSFETKNINNCAHMSQDSIGQRINFLIESRQLSIRKFARSLGISDTNVRNYIDRGSKPSSDVLEKIVRTFPDINTSWLLLGEGDPFLPDSPPTNTQNFHVQKNFRSPIVGTNHGTANQQQHIGSSESELQAAKQEIDTLKRELELHKALLASKEETIALLRATYNRPN